RTTGHLGLTDPVDFFKITLTTPGRLTARVHAPGLATRLSLFDPTAPVNLDRARLIQSDGQSPTNPDDLIDQHLDAVPAGTTYYLEVESLAGTGSYNLVTEFVPAVPPAQTLPVGKQPFAVVTGDFNGDGIPDVVTANLLDFTPSIPNNDTLSLLLGNGDGTFRT